MANEPERPIEKLLRTAAKKRGDEAGAPFELHPATRRLLQGEVARQFGKPQREATSMSSVLARLWPRLAWGTGILAVLGVVVWLMIPGTQDEKSPALLAKNQPVVQSAPTKGASSPAPDTAAPISPSPVAASPGKPAAVAYAQREERQLRSAAAKSDSGQKQRAKDDMPATAASEPMDKLLPAASRQSADRKEASEAETTISGGNVAKAPAGAVNGALGGRFGFAGAPAAPGNAPTAPAAPPPVAATPAPANAVAADESMKLKNVESARLAFADKSQSETASANRVSPAQGATGALGITYAASLKAEKYPGVSQRFAQVTKELKGKSALSAKDSSAHPVLASFQVEQSGSELRIVDGDGSVYSGYVRLGDTTRRARETRAEAPAAAAAAAAPEDVAAERPAAHFDFDQLLPQTYYFHVAGTNRTLHKKVVFTGNLLSAAYTNQPAPVSTNLGITSSVDGLKTGSTQLLAVPLLNTRISGKVVVGNGKAVEINAEPASP